MASSTFPLLSLPPELILTIADHLPIDAILALKLSHRILHSTLPVTPRLQNLTLSPCARLALRTYLAKPVSNPTHQRCLLCKAVYPLKSFHSSSSPVCSASLSFSGADVQDPNILKLPQGLCTWHVGRLVRIVKTRPGGRNEWVASREDMCMHCGAIRGWKGCGCGCESCAVREVTAYTRFLDNEVECRKYVFYRKDGRRLYVRETCKGDGSEEPEYVHMRVWDLGLAAEDVVEDVVEDVRRPDGSEESRGMVQEQQQPAFLLESFRSIWCMLSRYTTWRDDCTSTAHIHP
ncbi:hypothetical protein E8E13_004636 [Curvularia kusanoi]|uniref:F-box domain-containing protein n=1 Tax=Curvularia kusanoi TaxID=90978 RepID=A0A9P4W4I8_CURKU|nr:hypothetical protein E8E13_004636 [Curvularia kusanoi]